MYLTRIAGIETCTLCVHLSQSVMYLTRIAGIETFSMTREPLMVLKCILPA